METTLWQEGRRPPLVVLPYIEGVSETIRLVCQRFGMKVVFKTGQSLRSMPTKVKDPLTKEKQAKVSDPLQLRQGLHWRNSEEA